MALKTEILARAALEARGLAMDAVQAANSGHLGLPLGDAEIGAVLFGHALRYYPEDPHWINRDRFVLSAGHGSMFLYGWLHLAGYAVSLDEVRNFRQLHSITPGHPEFGETPGVESTTGPLGQGVGNSVGMAVSAKMAEARFNTPDHTIFDHKIVCLAGDGCLQEGVAAEAAAIKRAAPIRASRARATQCVLIVLISIVVAEVGTLQYVDLPPERSNTPHVLNEHSSLASQATSAAISPGSPKRLIGILESI